MADKHTVFGSAVNRTRWKPAYTINGMDDRTLADVLWENIRDGMVRKYGKENQTRLVRDSKIGTGTITRIKGSEDQPRGTSVGIEVIEKIAGALEMPPWLLLLPGGAGLVEPGDVNKFLEICRAWAQADDKGKEVILTAAEIARSKYAAPRGAGKNHPLPPDGG
jgi:hypothetical protein